MLLAVDIGNSNTKFGLFDGEHLVSKVSVPTNPDTFKNDVAEIFGDVTVTAAIICSVVPVAEQTLDEVLREPLGVEPILVRNDFDFGLKINYKPIASVGTDRLVNAFAAVEKYGVPCIVCSFGTATTIDVVNANREMLGGAIAPGMKTMATALSLNTAKLPEIEIAKPDSVIGDTTVGSILSGVFYGQIGMAEGMISRFQNEIDGKAKVIATGGFSRPIAEHTDLIDIVDPNLLLDGLRLLYDRHRRQSSA